MADLDRAPHRRLPGPHRHRPPGRADRPAAPTADALRDFEAGAWYHRTSPASHFTRSLVCSLLTEGGRITLSGHTLTTTTGAERTRTELPTDAAALRAYDQYFGIVLDRLPPRPDGAGV
ncbi:arylamine N-acetyltransferase [Streptomyces sp. NPDC049813]|uniref:arylamine N-acetyltransferase n=1 Tax=Streptomyces sp. NPDC049813 TaxID=3365597 RepID=UPI0037B14CBF